jgi:hypothetical protein
MVITGTFRAHHGKLERNEPKPINRVRLCPSTSTMARASGIKTSACVNQMAEK